MRLTADMEMEPVAGYRLASWERGYGDSRLAADLSTLRVASWLSKTALVICDVLSEQDLEPLMQTLRSILKRQLNQAADLGSRSWRLPSCSFQVSYGPGKKTLF